MPTDYLHSIYQESPPTQTVIEQTDPLKAYYYKFQRDAEKLTQEQKVQLIEEFSGQLDAAQSSEQWDKVTHYSRLIDILSNP